MARLILSSAVFLTVGMLVACGQPDDGKIAAAERAATAEAAKEGKVDCALAGYERFSRTCETETLSGPEGTTLTIRHPDGGFRRFVLLTDGRGLAAADGFDDTRISVLSDGLIEVRAGEDRYRLPASIKPSNNRTAEAAFEDTVSQP